jgi:cyclopropane fatty-acyl-phospholipid synthase-like methyltransferase
VEDYLEKIKGDLPHMKDTFTALLEQIPSGVKSVLDLGTGEGRLLRLVLQKNPDAKGVGVDFSEPMLKHAKEGFQGYENVVLLKHDLNDSLPKEWVGRFDLVVSGLAIHHVVDERKRELYEEVFELLPPGGVFLNLEHVASPTEELHNKFLASIGLTPETDDPSNKLLDVYTQVGWLKEIGYKDADCFYKWLEIALLGGVKP